MIASRPWIGWKLCTIDLEKPSTATRRKRRNLLTISVCKSERFNGLLLAILHHGGRQVLRCEICYVYEARSIRVYGGSLLEQIDGNALAVDDEDSLPKCA